MLTEFGRYLLTERLGTGSLTEAYRAKSFGVEGFEKAIVVKRVLPNLADLPGFLEAFVEQAKASLALSHANVAQVIDLGRITTELSGERVARDHTFIATELVEGTDIGTLLRHARDKQVEVPIGLALFVAAEVAKALDHAHKRRSGGVLHGPLTPQSVLVSWEGEVKVSDFAIHRALGAVRFEPDEARSLPYFSPEALRHEAPRPQSDVFSLGALLFELLTREVAFGGSDAEKTRARIAAATPRSVSSLRPEASGDIDELVSKMTAAEVSRRFGDAARLHEEIVALGYELGVSSSHVEMAAFVSRLCRRGEAPTRLSEDLPASFVEATPTPSAVTRAEKREATLLVATGLDTTDGRSELLLHIERAGGVVLSRDGTEVRAVFGLRDADGRDTEAAVGAALDLLRDAPETGIGIDLARVMVDEQGVVVGDVELAASFALAARLASSQKGCVRVSRAAGRAVEREIELEAESGDDESLRATARRARSLPSSRFVGRRAQVEDLGKAFGRAVRGELTTAFVVGERGVGKTRLLAELERRLAKLPAGAHFFRAACPRDWTGSPTPFAAVAELTRALIGTASIDGAVGVSEVEPRGAKDEGGEIVRRLRSLGLDENDTSELVALASATKRLASEKSPARALGRVLERLARDGTVVVALDDVQFLDSASARVLETVFSEAEPRRVLLILAGRSLPRGVFSRTEPTLLGPLDEADVAVLTAGLLGARVLPPELVGYLNERAEGSPLLVELIVKELSDAALVTVRQGIAQVDLAHASVPRTLRAIIEGRLARLESSSGPSDPGPREVLRAMAVLGSGATNEEISAFVDVSFDRVNAVLAEPGVKALLSVGRLSGTLAEVVLETIPAEERARSHARAAELVGAAGEPTGERLDRVGAHLAASGDASGAAFQFARAAALHANPLGVGVGHRVARPDLAARSAARALSTADLDELEASDLRAWLSILAESVVRSRARVGFVDIAANVIERIDAVGDPSARVLARLDVARIAAAESSFAQAEVVLAQARDLCHDSDLLARALSAEVELAERTGEITRGRDAARALSALGPVGDARVLLDAATLFAEALDLAEATRAIDLAYEIGLVDTAALRASVEARRARVLLIAGEATSAQRTSLLAADLAEAHELFFDVASAKLTLADAYLALDRPERACAAFVEALEAAEGAGHERLVVLARAGLAFVEGLRAHLAKSQAAPLLLSRIVQETEARGFIGDALYVRLLLGRLELARGDLVAARNELERAEKQALFVGHRALARDCAKELLRCG